ncbi:hypothetical protein DPMN_187855 [Dreissena polymorpha]|uniref:Uncharacterized protein n=1 Tax=Dreissena polymorpha TaxID=45954 RepID=A0A9D4I7X5_DREPO|nr:hypothetical protein DPMN_187855 [Dreissena polymorpha]
MQAKIDSIDFDNKNLIEKIKQLENINEINKTTLQEQIDQTNEISKTAHTKANYNEQYARKNKIKILNIPENKEEYETSLAKTVSDILQINTEVDLQPIDVVAVLRIPTKKGQIRPVIIKLRNNSVNMPSCGKGHNEKQRV